MEVILIIVGAFIVDLGNTGTVARIISFLGIGALLLVVGYFAPANGIIKARHVNIAVTHDEFALQKRATFPKSASVSRNNPKYST